MPALARDFEVIAVDQRGIRLTEKRALIQVPIGGGHLAAWEEPQLFSEELRAASRTLRS